MFYDIFDSTVGQLTVVTDGRVVGSDGAMAGYVAGVECKEWLLRLEQKKDWAAKRPPGGGRVSRIC